MSDQRLLYSIITYLKTLKVEGDDKADNIETITDLLQQTFDVPNTPEIFLNSYYPVTLQDIFTNYTTSTIPPLETPDEMYNQIKENAKFESFVKLVTAKGYFEGSEIGTVEYLEKQTKLVLKFKEKALATNTSILSAAENEKQAEIKKGLGNVAISSKDYEGAVAYYTEALELSSEG